MIYQIQFSKYDHPGRGQEHLTNGLIFIFFFAIIIFDFTFFFFLKSYPSNYLREKTCVSRSRRGNNVGDGSVGKIKLVIYFLRFQSC